MKSSWNKIDVVFISLYVILNSRFQVFDHEGPDREKLENPMAAASDNTSCTSFHCKWLLRNAVSYHLHFKRRSMSDNIALAKNMADSHQKFHSTPHGNLNGSNRRLRSGQESDGHSNSDTKLQLAVQALWQKPSAEWQAQTLLWSTDSCNQNMT